MKTYTVLGTALLAGAVVLPAQAATHDDAVEQGSVPTGPAKTYDLQVAGGAGEGMPTAVVDLDGKPQQRYILSAGLPGEPLAIVATGKLDGHGEARLQLEYPAESGPVPLEFKAAFVARRGVYETGPEVLVPSGVDSTCQVFNFDWYTPVDEGDGGPVPTFPGQVISPGNTWTQTHGLTIRVMNFGGGPDLGVIFDSWNPTGGDDDLSSPIICDGCDGDGGGGFEPIDTPPYSRIVIIQENPAGCDTGDCDIPDDEAGGGKMFLIWEQPVRMCWLDLLDIDEAQGALVETFGPEQDGGPVLLDSIVVEPGEDNCTKRVFFSGHCVTSVEITFPGSGALAEFGYEVCTFDD